MIGANIGGIPEFVVEERRASNSEVQIRLDWGAYYVKRATDEDAYKIMQVLCRIHLKEMPRPILYKKMIDIYTTVMNRNVSAI